MISSANVIYLNSVRRYLTSMLPIFCLGKACRLAVAHDQFLALDMHQLKAQKGAVIYDVKGVLPREVVDARL